MELKAVDLIQLAGQVLDHAIFLGLIEYNLARNNLSKKLVTEKAKHHAAFTDPRELGEFLCQVEDYSGAIVMKYYLGLMPYLFTRNTELRLAKWSEFDLERDKLWIIPKERMKIKDDDHLVPLPEQVVKRLLELKALNLSDIYVFPTPRARTSPISTVGPLGAIRQMGYTKEVLTIHGFRTTASTALMNSAIMTTILKSSSPTLKKMRSEPLTIERNTSTIAGSFYRTGLTFLIAFDWKPGRDARS